METGNPEKTMGQLRSELRRLEEKAASLEGERDVLRARMSALKGEYDNIVNNALKIIGEKREILAEFRDVANEHRRITNENARLAIRLESAEKILSTIRNNIFVRVLLALRGGWRKLTKAPRRQPDAAHRKGNPGDG